MTRTVPIAVIIPTYNRGVTITRALNKIDKCDPKPAEIWTHIDLADGTLEGVLREQFPDVRVLTSPVRLGPGGGRHRCLVACSTAYAVSFDDDSYPVDPDFFSCVERLFSEHPQAAVFGASIWQRHEAAKLRTNSLDLVDSYVGCGHAIRLTAYRQVRGYLPRPYAFRMEESDLSLQLFAAGWQIYKSGDLRVFHDTDLRHRESSENVSTIITNVGLCAFLHYPIVGWGWGAAQVANIVAWHILRGKIHGICSGIFRIPIDCYRNRRYRKPIAWKNLRRFLQFRRTGILSTRSTT
jgi:GT2 family glycosyltransferase